MHHQERDYIGSNPKGGGGGRPAQPGDPRAKLAGSRERGRPGRAGFRSRTRPCATRPPPPGSRTVQAAALAGRDRLGRRMSAAIGRPDGRIWGAIRRRRLLLVCVPVEWFGCQSGGRSSERERVGRRCGQCHEAAECDCIGKWRDLVNTKTARKTTPIGSAGCAMDPGLTLQSGARSCILGERFAWWQRVAGGCGVGRLLLSGLDDPCWRATRRAAALEIGDDERGRTVKTRRTLLTVIPGDRDNERRFFPERWIGFMFSDPETGDAHRRSLMSESIGGGSLLWFVGFLKPTGVPR